MTDISKKTAQRLLTVMTGGTIVSKTYNAGLTALVERGHAIGERVYNPAGAPIPDRVAYRITAKGRTWLNPTRKPLIRESTKTSAAPTDPRQIDIEAAIAAASSGGAPECAPLAVFDASTGTTADVSAPVGRSSKPALAAAPPESVSP